jgi:glycosyltransferase involved in cell wall biosynthesis
MVFVGESNPWWEDQLRSARARFGDLPVCFIPFVAHERLPQYVVDADVGVIIYDDTVRNHVYCEPGKLSDYISANVPVVAPDFPTIRSLLVQGGVGRTFPTAAPEAIARTITAVLDAGEGIWSTALATARQTMTWETQRVNLLSALDRGQVGMMKEFSE